MRLSRLVLGLGLSLVPLALASSAKANVVFGNFEDGMFDGFGYLSNSMGVQPFPASPGPTASIITPGSGGDLTHVLDLSGTGFNQGQSGGAALGYDFKANGLATEFMNDDQLSFDWEVAPSSTSSGYSQLYNIVLNAPGGGFKTVAGSSNPSPNLGTGTVNQNPGYTGQVNHVVINYDSYKALITANPSYLQLGIQTNVGGGAPPDIYFDNFTLTAIPEPASLSLLGIAGAALLGRRRSR
jgi:hypothetical protein